MVHDKLNRLWVTNERDESPVRTAGVPYITTLQCRGEQQARLEQWCTAMRPCVPAVWYRCKVCCITRHQSSRPAAALAWTWPGACQAVEPLPPRGPRLWRRARRRTAPPPMAAPLGGTCRRPSAPAGRSSGAWHHAHALHALRESDGTDLQTLKTSNSPARKQGSSGGQQLEKIHQVVPHLLRCRSPGGIAEPGTDVVAWPWRMRFPLRLRHRGRFVSRIAHCPQRGLSMTGCRPTQMAPVEIHAAVSVLTPRSRPFQRHPYF